MKHSLIWFLLGLSVALNAFFIGGYIYAERQASRLTVPAAGKARLITERLGLDRRQRELFLGYRRELIAEAGRFRRQRQALQRRLWQALEADTPDPRRLDAVLGDLGDVEDRFHRRVVESVRGFAQDLRPEQRHRLLKLLARRDIFALLTKPRQVKPGRRPPRRFSHQGAEGTVFPAGPVSSNPQSYHASGEGPRSSPP